MTRLINVRMIIHIRIVRSPTVAMVGGTRLWEKKGGEGAGKSEGLKDGKI